ncbi:MAG: hypothetical protein OXI97_18730 [Acidimicrobiaceae bacterium]|nr:hypothetical protein [Acidimicrobiaceae bacterium]
MSEAFAELDLSDQPDKCLYIFDGLTGHPQRALFLSKPLVKSGDLTPHSPVILTTPQDRRFPVMVTALRRTFTDDSVPDPFKRRQVIEMLFRAVRPADSESGIAATA